MLFLQLKYSTIKVQHAKRLLFHKLITTILWSVFYADILQIAYHLRRKSVCIRFNFNTNLSSFYLAFTLLCAHCSPHVIVILCVCTFTARIYIILWMVIVFGLSYFIRNLSNKSNRIFYTFHSNKQIITQSQTTLVLCTHTSMNDWTKEKCGPCELDSLIVTIYLCGTMLIESKNNRFALKIRSKCLLLSRNGMRSKEGHWHI